MAQSFWTNSLTHCPEDRWDLVWASGMALMAELAPAAGSAEGVGEGYTCS